MKILLTFLIVILFIAFWYWWKRHPLHRSIWEILSKLAHHLSLENTVFKRYPVPTISGDYFGFHLSMEGLPRKGFRFFAHIELPKKLSTRIFLQSEHRKTSLKPIAGLKLVSTDHEEFNRHFLLLADDETLAKSVFQPYLCSKILSLQERNWQIDVHGEGAHFEMKQEQANVEGLAELLRTVMEYLNALTVVTSI